MSCRKRTRRDFLKAAGVCAAGVALGGCVEDGPRYALPTTPVYRPAKPNILWITCEDISPYLGCWGDPLAITPNLDRLAGRSIRYTNAYATAPVCSPSRSCLITGVYATSLGTQHLRSQIAIPKQIEPFPKLLRAAGYYCTNNFKEDYNFRDPAIWDDSSRTAHWRNRPAGQPFFSVFNFTSTHQSQINGSDEQFEAQYRSKLAPEERHDAGKMILPPYYPDTPVVRKMWARYYDLITYMDKQVGEILDQLEADAITESTIVFFFSDHGMGLPRFKRTLYDSGLHVPLLVRVPSRYQSATAFAPGGREDRLVSFVDFAPTVLSLAGVSIPSHMQGMPFLGRASSAREYVVGAASRVDEAYEMARCVRDQRFKYIRNFLPHLPYVQPSDYCDRAEIMQELRRVAASGGMAGMEGLLWQPTRPVEELYDTLADPNEVRNLAGSPAHQETLNRMRTRLRDWMLDTRDTGLLPEAEMHIRAAGSTPSEMARDPAKCPLSDILSAAELVGSGANLLTAMVESLSDADSAVRYWTVIYLASLGAEAAPATEALKAALNDPSPDVRFAAADVLCGLGSCEEVLPVLMVGLLDSREAVVLHAARTLQRIGSKAAPLVREMERTRGRCKNLDGSYRNDNYAMFIDWALQHAIENCKP
ncbi:MAG TPA: sulfatase-like hydrolase/transferase [Sedimentisphaerales bacterium]|jgi:N-sulfoglucosamine sulfohydrolase|nr:sulfatase-like hydrolase/transferase [Sedimentisphaerales bacterium]HNU31101.1 sulfatase-like hydrolase/transferase [Sedimentisphaerales bacterium]